MSQNRRRFLAASGTALAGSLAGCVGFILGNDALEVSASKATVSQSARDDTGYEENTVEKVELERTFEAGGQERTVVATNWQAEYHRSVDVQGFDSFEGAKFVAFSTPKVEIANKTFNPVGDRDHRDLVTLVQDSYEGLESVTGVGEYTAGILGSQATVGEYEGEATFAGTGQTVDLSLHVTNPIEHDEDFIVCVGAYPNYPPLTDGEGGNVETLFGGVEH